MPKVMIEMEMPKSCYHCPIEFGDIASGCHRCAITMENNSNYRDGEQRHPKCPLKEVKE